MNYDLVILTTACSRSKLHTQSLSNVPKLLDGYNCKWIIRVDHLKDEAVDNTIKNLNCILDSEHIDLQVVSSNRDAGRISWFKSVKWIINEGFKYKPKFGYFWLEDDWGFNTDKTLKSVLENSNNTIPSENFYISLAKRVELSFNPCIWSPDLYEKYMYDKINNAVMPDNGGNAERACVYDNGSVISRVGINFIKHNLFFDVGRQWAANNINGKRTFYF
jgi:hypothetical protein